MPPCAQRQADPPCTSYKLRALRALLFSHELLLVCCPQAVPAMPNRHPQFTNACLQTLAPPPSLAPCHPCRAERREEVGARSDAVWSWS